MRNRCRKSRGGYLERHGRLDPGTVEDMLEWSHEGGFSLDASVCMDSWDRDALERLTRYCARPPFASGRLAPIDENTVAYELRKPTQDGRTCLFMDPLELMGRLAALIPPPRAHLVPFAGIRSGLLDGQLRYFGVPAPNAKLREQVIQTAGPSPALLERLCQAAECMGIEEGGGGAGRSRVLRPRRGDAGSSGGG